MNGNDITVDIIDRFQRMDQRLDDLTSRLEEVVDSLLGDVEEGRHKAKVVGAAIRWTRRGKGKKALFLTLAIGPHRVHDWILLEHETTAVLSFSAGKLADIGIKNPRYLLDEGRHEELALLLDGRQTEVEVEKRVYANRSFYAIRRYGR